MEIESNYEIKLQQEYAVIQQAIQGNELAYATLLHKFHNAVHSIVLRTVGKTNEPEDLTIEIFTKAFCNLKSYQPQFSFAAWLFRIATNHCIDFLRKKKQNAPLLSIDQANIEEQFITSNLLSELPNPEENLILQQNVEELHDVIEQLSPDYQAVVNMYYLKELSTAEIAQLLNIPQNTVKTRLFRTKDLLMNIMKPKKSA